MEDGDVSWFESGISVAWEQEYIMASLALVHHATSTGSEGDLRYLMSHRNHRLHEPRLNKPEMFLISGRHARGTTEQGMVKEVKELIEFMPDKKSTNGPLMHVGILHSYSIYTTTK